MRILPRAVSFAAFAIVAAMTGVAAGVAPGFAQPVVTTPSGLKIIEIKVGTGPAPKLGQTVVVNYTGWLYQDGKRGTKFDSSADRLQPLEFPIGRGEVIRGWDEGIATMRVGGRRTLIIPPNLAYGERGIGGVIPSNSTLIFDVELVRIKG